MGIDVDKGLDHVDLHDNPESFSGGSSALGQPTGIFRGWTGELIESPSLIIHLKS